MTSTGHMWTKETKVSRYIIWDPFMTIHDAPTSSFEPPIVSDSIQIGLKFNFNFCLKRFTCANTLEKSIAYVGHKISIWRKV
jgi:hypothetical protein